MDNFLRLQFGNADKFIEKHLQNKLPLGQVFIIIPTVLSFAGNRWNWESRVKEVEFFLQPLEVTVASLYFQIERQDQYFIGDVGFLKESSLLLIVLQDLYL